MRCCSQDGLLNNFNVRPASCPEAIYVLCNAVIYTRSNQRLENCVRSECSIVRRIVFQRGCKWESLYFKLCEIYSNLIAPITRKLNTRTPPKLYIYAELDLPKYFVEFIEITRPKASHVTKFFFHFRNISTFFPFRIFQVA